MPSAEQQAVITSRNPVVIVIGGAGSGKTTTAAAAAGRRLTEIDHGRAEARAATRPGALAGLPPRKRVLFVSFSRTAVSQILDRSAEVLGPLRDRVDVVTFHGLAWRILNDFGRFYGHPYPVRVQSRAESEVSARFPGVSYDELVPAASALLAVPTVRDYYRRRYGTVICDEFQDTSNAEWAFIQTISPDAQRILLGDPNQCIYAGMKNIDPQARIAEASALAGAAMIELPPQSYRDPSGALPAAALAALERRFGDPTIAYAVSTARIILHLAPAANLAEAVSHVVVAEQAAGNTVSVFTHTHAATAELSTVLSEVGIDHEQVGFTEAFGDGLQAQFSLLRWALDGNASPRQALAVYVHSIAHGRTKKRFADAVVRKTIPAFEAELKRVALDLQVAAKVPPDIDELLVILAGAHQRLGFPRGEDTWLRSNRQLRRVARVLERGGSLEDLTSEVEELRVGTLVGSRAGRPKPVQVMNLHQTKGREADVTVLLLQPDEFHGYEAEPYPTGSRLLYVCLTRAREGAHIVVPDAINNLHGLWLPFIDACIVAQQT
ncbi:ATP-dependent helicase [Kribbella pittospori]|uniref:ATP-dependent helicase n=1 Tax=Kribbella pittospori TaxID=722689 RepID=A0A4R0KX95_9ACTN|nr:UvrD-helicase domain-containing protein [Kribbella pittospori]TCC65701.1 ATP-dependent helicase [Kribbella pittospori]